MKTYSDYLSRFFPGIKIQKISIDAGFSCPNRNGTISTGGCIYCRNDSFTPGYCNSKLSVKEQLEKGKNFFSRKYPEMKYLAYFQSYTGTFKKTPEELHRLYSEALDQPDIVGLVIATRPDCLPDQTLDIISELNQKVPVFIEIGAESSHNQTLYLINRNHTWEEVTNAVNRVSKRNIHCGIHLIAGLPGENEEMILDTIDKAVTLPIETIKLHQLQVLKDTLLLQKIMDGEISVPYFSLEQYLQLCVRIIKRVPDNIIIERFLSQSPPDMVVTPSWGLKNYEFMNKLQQLI